MPLGVKDILFVLRAKDEASRVITQAGMALGAVGESGKLTSAQVSGIGSALMGAGVAIGAVGAAGLAFFVSATKAAIEYRQESALTLTQVSAVGAKLSDVMQIGINVANEIPVPFKEVQKALYDIFSSGLNPTLAESQTLLQNYAKAAVAGQTDIANVSRLTTGVMLAYKVPIQDINKILDIQFRMVQLGVGNYEDFVTTLGRAIGPAVAANQSFSTLAATVAFLTENGLTAANAATSAGRAMELMAKPDVTAALEASGIKVRDSAGNFRQMNDIITQLAVNKGWAKLTGPELATAFHDVFGTGSIQARRFFDIAIPNFAKYNDVIGQMTGSAGSAAAAYDIMLQQPQSQATLLNNKWQILKTTVGEAVLPIFMKLLTVGTDIINWFNGLDTGLRNQIIKWALIGSAIAFVVGIGLILVGMFLSVAAAVMAAFGVGLIAAIGIIAAFVGGLLLIIGVVIAVIVWHKQLLEFYHQHETLLKILGIALMVIVSIAFSWIAVLAAIVAAVILAIQHHRGLATAWNYLWQVGKTVVEALAQAWNWLWANVIKPVIDWIRAEIAQFSAWWNAHWDEMKTVFESIWAYIKTILTVSWTYMRLLIQVGLDVLKVAWSVAWVVIKDVFNTAWNIMRDIVVGIWQVISHTIDAFIKIVTGVIGIGLDLITGHWGKAWNDLVAMVRGVWNDVVGAVKGIMSQIINVIVDAASGFGKLLWDAGVALIRGLVGGAKSIIGDVVGAMKDMANAALDGIKGVLHIGSPSRLTYQYGQWFVEGLVNGITDNTRLAQNAVNNLLAMPGRSPTALQGAGRGTAGSGPYIHLEVHPGAFAPQINAGAGDGASIATSLKPVQEDFVDTLVQQLRAKV